MSPNAGQKVPKARCLLGLTFVVSQYFGSWFSRDKAMLTSVPRYLRHMSRGISGNLFDNGCLASEARQAEGEALVGKYGWEAWVCGQAGRFASLSTYPCRPPTYPSRWFVHVVLLSNTLRDGKLPVYLAKIASEFNGNSKLIQICAIFSQSVPVPALNSAGRKVQISVVRNIWAIPGV